MNALGPAAVNPIADDALAGVAVSDRSGASGGHDPVFELVSNIISTILITQSVLEAVRCDLPMVRAGSLWLPGCVHRTGITWRLASDLGRKGRSFASISWLLIVCRARQCL